VTDKRSSREPPWHHRCRFKPPGPATENLFWLAAQLGWEDNIARCRRGIVPRLPAEKLPWNRSAGSWRVRSLDMAVFLAGDWVHSPIGFRSSLRERALAGRLTRHHLLNGSPRRSFLHQHGYLETTHPRSGHDRRDHFDHGGEDRCEGSGLIAKTATASRLSLEWTILTADPRAASQDPHPIIQDAPIHVSRELSRIRPQSFHKLFFASFCAE